MRCRHFGIRYTMVLMAGQPPACGKEGWWIRRMPAAALAHSHWRPDADVVETVGAITVTVELAGVDEEGRGRSPVRGRSGGRGPARVAPVRGGRGVHVAAIRQGPFRIEVPLSARIDPKGVVARANAASCGYSRPAQGERRDES